MISNEEAVKRLREILTQAVEFENFVCYAAEDREPLEMAIEALEQEPKTGHWIKQTLSVKPFGEDTVLCDQCGFLTDKYNCYDYCPKCGAKM